MRCRDCQLAYPVSAEGPFACPACGAVPTGRVEPPIVLAAVATTDDGRVLGWTDIDSFRVWLESAENGTFWSAAGFWRREREFREGSSH